MDFKIYVIHKFVPEQTGNDDRVYIIYCQYNDPELLSRLRGHSKFPPPNQKMSVIVFCFSLLFSNTYSHLS